MAVRRVSVDRLLDQPSGRGMVAIPFALIVAITVADLQSGPSVHLGPLLVIAPAMAASFAGPRLTAVIGVAAVAAQVLIAVFHGGLATTNHMAQIIALTALSALVVFVCYMRERRDRQLSRARSVAETAQLVLLRPPPHRIGPLRVAWLYLAAEDETRIGGDLFALARAAHPSTRVVIGDVRGKGLAAIGEASIVLGAFREGAHRCATLPELVTAVEESVHRDLEEVADTRHDPGEHFTTALILDIPDHDPQAQMIDCGHPPPLLVHDHHVTVMTPRSPTPPLGVCELSTASHRTDPFTFETGDILLLYTDGVIEARSAAGTFYPLAERVAGFPASSPDTLLRCLYRDLLTHTGEQITDDAAVLAIERTASHHPHRPRTTAHSPVTVTEAADLRRPPRA
ncbi:PP2C family protein-serine/threonine phosphatase [Streptomyces mirabilis]|uniref:PP2C family protein-serine/threonine phosphatase n=1 Tax=Streptomyces mirabilis TaxID=68239 RepID=UPI0022506651|nr:PP2C family protein-serine/threonine phosphatase [Streptomyces mirabilis]MCX4429125.1 serine/threonine-protein phosphatase [Streptomyces mirabilis]MCX4429283.1 serine/threonine-protein phosphatase [Streptomyces mirabilis]